MDLGTFRVMALHALVYCERLFYLEEVEEIRVADERVWAGRREHLELGETDELVQLTLESARLGIRGRVDAVRKRDGTVFPVEHKRGRSHVSSDGSPQAWDSDHIQIGAYALLLEEHLDRRVVEGRIRYHADNKTVRVPLDDRLRIAVSTAVSRAQQLSASSSRPAITAHASRCARCSLVPVCLPEEQRFGGPATDAEHRKQKPKRLFPTDSERRPLHLLGAGSKVGRSGRALHVTDRDGSRRELSVRSVSDLVLHGNVQISTQALRLCANNDIPVHILSHGGEHLGCFIAGGGVQRRLRQYAALASEKRRGELATRLVMAKVELQLRHVLRGSRRHRSVRAAQQSQIAQIRQALRSLSRSSGADRDVLLGHEGAAARAYFACITELQRHVMGDPFVPNGRTQRPPRDRFNAVLSFGYALLYRSVLSAILQVGLEPSFGFLHQPRSAAFPLALDIMEIFRVPLVDIATVGAVNRKTFDPEEDFVVTGPRVWLSTAGRRKAIEVFERRKLEEYQHPVLKYRISYGRMIELEVRLLEKEWSGEAGLFGRLRLR